MKRRVLKIGMVIRLMRLADGIGPARLARELGVPKLCLEKIENGKKEADMALLRKVARRFGVPLPLLLLTEEIRSDHDVLHLLRDTFVGLLAARAVEREELARESRRARLERLCSTCPVEQARMRWFREL